MQGWNPQKPDGNDTTTISHCLYILSHFANYALCLLVVCIGGSGEGSAGYMHGHCVVDSL